MAQKYKHQDRDDLCEDDDIIIVTGNNKRIRTEHRPSAPKTKSIEAYIADTARDADDNDALGGGEAEEEVDVYDDNESVFEGFSDEDEGDGDLGGVSDSLVGNSSSDSELSEDEDEQVAGPVYSTIPPATPAVSKRHVPYSKIVLHSLDDAAYAFWHMDIRVALDKWILPPEEPITRKLAEALIKLIPFDKPNEINALLAERMTEAGLKCITPKIVHQVRDCLEAAGVKPMQLRDMPPRQLTMPMR